MRRKSIELLFFVTLGFIQGVASFNVANHHHLSKKHPKHAHHPVVRYRPVMSKSMPQRARYLFMSRKDDGSNREEDLDLFLPLAGSAVLFVAFWPLLALLRDTNDPTTGFDIDMFMSLKGILDDVPQDELGILEFPPLSPGERLVDAIFGLPSP